MNWDEPTGAVVAALLVFIGGLLTYVFQKRVDRRETVRARHFDIYVEMVEAICAMGNAHNRGSGIEDALSNYATAKMKFCVVASDEVLEKFLAFDRLITSGEKVPHAEFDGALAAFMHAARVETLGGSQLSPENLTWLTPFGRSIRDRQTK